MRLHNIQFEGRLIFHVVHISETRMIETGIDALYRGNYLGVIMRGIYLLNFISLHLGYLERLKKLEGCIKAWWRPGLEMMIPGVWLIIKKGKGAFIWVPDPESKVPHSKYQRATRLIPWI